MGSGLSGLVQALSLHPVNPEAHDLSVHKDKKPRDKK